MKIYMIAVIFIAMTLFIPAYSQAEGPAVQEAPGRLEEAAPQAAKEAPAEEMTVYGEVKAVNAASNSVSLEYYDYDSDEEKRMEVVLDANTKLENAAALASVKEGDWIDVVYSLSDGKNLAKSVAVEEDTEFEEDLATEAKAPAAVDEE